MASCMKYLGFRICRRGLKLLPEPREDVDGPT